MYLVCIRHQTSRRQKFLSLIICRQLTENNWNPQKSVSLCFGSNNFRSNRICGYWAITVIYGEHCCLSKVENIQNPSAHYLHATNYHANLNKSVLLKMFFWKLPAKEIKSSHCFSCILSCQSHCPFVSIKYIPLCVFFLHETFPSIEFIRKEFQCHLPPSKFILYYQTEKRKLLCSLQIISVTELFLFQRSQLFQHRFIQEHFHTHHNLFPMSWT